MGTDLTTPLSADQGQLAETLRRSVPWLDGRTAELVRAIVAAAGEHPEVVAAILIGSIARHDERPLDDSHPSDVDVLLLVEVPPGQTDVSSDLMLAICHTLGEAEYRFGDAPREVHRIIAARDLTNWDATFVESVARDGLLLWARGPLPPSLASLAERWRRARGAAAG